MTLSRKNFAAIALADIEELVSRGVRENSELEFKGELPFKLDKGTPEIKVDRWITKGDRLGDYARDEILAELVSFANADGGTLVIGVREDKSDEGRASGLNPIPQCEDLARRVLNYCEDSVEPPLSYVAAKGVISDAATGAGFVVLRVARSLSGPHRVRSNAHFFIRRGERAAKMTVREIKDATLSLTHFASHAEAVLNNTKADADTLFAARRSQSHPQEGFLHARAVAYPLAPLAIPELTNRREFWWRGDSFVYFQAGRREEVGFPATYFNSQPEIGLRKLVVRPELYGAHSQVGRVLRDDGLVEFSMTLEEALPQGRASYAQPFYVDWAVGLLTGVIGQVDHLRKLLAADALEFGCTLVVRSKHPLSISSNSRRTGGTFPEHMSLDMPVYSIRGQANFDEVLYYLVRDLWNATGVRFEGECSANWSEILRHPR